MNDNTFYGVWLLQSEIMDIIVGVVIKKPYDKLATPLAKALV